VSFKFFYTGGKLITGGVDTGGKFTIGVNDTGSKYPPTPIREHFFNKPICKYI
jgi:hypothetical protein